MRSIAAFFLSLFAMMAIPAAAQVMSVETWVEEWNPHTQEWVRVEEGAERFVAPRAIPRPAAIAQYGSFHVIDGERAALMGLTDVGSPGDFAAMLRDFPNIATLEMIECPGTANDTANLRLGRMIREAGLTTRVPAGGSVRSGAVELFLAGASREMDEGAEFAVHSWLDTDGRQPGDFADSAPVNQSYLAFYRDMGFAADKARAFYDMTNSVPHEQALWLTAQDMQGWITPELPRGEEPLKRPRLDYAQLALSVVLETTFN